jgi:4-hydroxy-tetrahydrodipicolinate reductase
MRIALIGYGKMGQAIETIAIEKGHTISFRIDLNNPSDWDKININNTDVAIEFTSPHSAVDNLHRLFRLGIPVVCGSTGWLSQWKEITKACEEQNGSFVYASNYSVGVNIFFELNRKLATLMAAQPDYAVSLQEIHHTQKKDAPSGTAVTLAEDILHARPDKTKWVNHVSPQVDEIPIISERIDPAPGTHHVKYQSAIDDIEIIHTAHNRTGFATGAVLAASFICNKNGIYSMRDVLGL